MGLGELPVTFFGIATVLILGASAGVGLWRRCKWAWFAGQLYCMWFIYSALRGWLVHDSKPNIPQIALLVLSGIAVGYLYLRRPRSYFEISKTVALVSFVGLCLAASAFYHATTWIDVMIEEWFGI